MSKRNKAPTPQKKLTMNDPKYSGKWNGMEYLVRCGHKGVGVTPASVGVTPASVCVPGIDDLHVRSSNRFHRSHHSHRSHRSRRVS